MLRPPVSHRAAIPCSQGGVGGEEAIWAGGGQQGSQQDTGSWGPWETFLQGMVLERCVCSQESPCCALDKSTLEMSGRG